MKITTTGKQIDVGDALRAHVDDRLGDVVDKYFDRAIEAAVTFSRDRHQFRADIAVHAGRNIRLQGHASADDAYVAFDQAADRIAKRLRRHKRRIRDHRATPGDEAALAALQYVIAEDSSSEGDEEAVGGDEPAIVAETATQILALSVGEAVMHMDLADQPALMFRNRANGRLNTVYRRPDGHIGWIDPQE
jgi:ribosomal subunit interface protein